MPGGRVKGGLGVGTGDTGVRLERRMLRGARIWRRMLETADAGMHIGGPGGAGPGGGAEAGRTGCVQTGEADVEGNGGCGSQRMVGVLRVLRLGCLWQKWGVLERSRECSSGRCARLRIVDVLWLGNLGVLGMLRLKVLGKACGLGLAGRLIPSSFLVPSPDCEGGGKTAGDEGTAGGR